ncbi:hemerythrin domain-containing protein [Streptomyces sp. NPDC018031]|uniref:hemerythrin domain-containing protein n=1 Tax=Streptomyces sp. NPDC018031 TaxID=3365033 RepID=UPI0037B44D5C
MGRDEDVIAELTADHREVDGLLERIDAVPPGDPERKRLVDRLTAELVRHSVTEEEYLYPSVREHVEHGNALADEELAEHARIEGLLKDLERRGADDPAFDGLVSRLAEEVRAHLLDEERRLFTLLRAACGEETLARLGERLRRARKTAPAWPHPAAPHTPLAGTVLTPGTGLVDRAREALGGRAG